MGHYKAIINDPERKKKDKSKRQIDMVEIIVTMTNLHAEYGFALWKKALDAIDVSTNRQIAT